MTNHSSQTKERQSGKGAFLFPETARADAQPPDIGEGDDYDVGAPCDCMARFRAFASDLEADLANAVKQVAKIGPLINLIDQTARAMERGDSYWGAHTHDLGFKHAPERYEVAAELLFMWEDKYRRAILDLLAPQRERYLPRTTQSGKVDKRTLKGRKLKDQAVKPAERED